MLCSPKDRTLHQYIDNDNNNNNGEDGGDSDGGDSGKLVEQVSFSCSKQLHADIISQQYKRESVNLILQQKHTNTYTDTHTHTYIYVHTLMPMFI